MKNSLEYSKQSANIRNKLKAIESQASYANAATLNQFIKTIQSLLQKPNHLSPSEETLLTTLQSQIEQLIVEKSQQERVSLQNQELSDAKKEELKNDTREARLEVVERRYDYLKDKAIESLKKKNELLSENFESLSNLNKARVSSDFDRYTLSPKEQNTLAEEDKLEAEFWKLHYEGKQDARACIDYYEKQNKKISNIIKEEQQDFNKIAELQAKQEQLKKKDSS